MRQVCLLISAVNPLRSLKIKLSGFLLGPLLIFEIRKQDFTSENQDFGNGKHVIEGPQILKPKVRNRTLATLYHCHLPQRNLDKIENDKNEVEFCFSFISFTLGKIRKNDKTEVDFRFSVK